MDHRAASASPSTRWAATTARPRSCPGVLDYARAHLDDELILVGDTATLRGIAGELPRNVAIVPAGQVIGMEEHPASAIREKKDASILVATDLVRDGRGRRGRDRRTHRRGHGCGDPQARPPAGRRPAGARGPDGHRHGPVRAPRHRRQARLDPREPRPVRADGRDLRRAGARASRDPRVALLSIGEEKGKGEPASSARPSCSTPRTCGSSATSRAGT